MPLDFYLRDEVDSTVERVVIVEQADITGDLLAP